MRQPRHTSRDAIALEMMMDHDEADFSEPQMSERAVSVMIGAVFCMQIVGILGILSAYLR